jgi:hypothetical protein
MTCPMRCLHILFNAMNSVISFSSHAERHPPWVVNHTAERSHLQRPQSARVENKSTSRARSQDGREAYVDVYARVGRADGAFGYFGKIVEDMESNNKEYESKLPIRLVAVVGEHVIPNMAPRCGPPSRT